MTKTTIAVFDFDNTLTTKDSLVPFLCFVLGPKKIFSTLFLLIPQFVKYQLKFLTRQQMKETILSKTIKGMHLENVKEQGSRFAELEIPKLLNSKMMEHLLWHQSQGHACYILSAGLDLYISAWGKQNHIFDTLASKCAVDSNGNLTGRLEGLNCWGPEKVRRLMEKIKNRENYIIYAYGDSRGDSELLSLADHAYYRGKLL